MPRGIAVKHECPSLVVERVQHDLDKIVVSQRIAGQHVRADEPWRFVFAHESREKIFSRVPQIGDGRFGHGPSVFRITIDEIADAQHLFCGWRTRGPGEKVIQARLTLQSRNGDVAGVDDRWV